MDEKRWQKIQDMFEHALALPPEERHGLIEAACNGDESLRMQVISLIDASANGDSHIRKVIASAADEVGSAEKTSDDRIGAYRVESELGRGGMGTVYLAVRDDDEFNKKVAIKIVRSGFDSEELLRRFRSERQILANLDHPNIARLLDGGTTADGAPYVVMEYVDGTSINDYCERNSLGLEARLELFRKVCSAVNYAHQNLVVHRDIKPSNILVASDGTPKLLDFGIAKLLDPETSDETEPITRADMRLMTPEYASPEQVSGRPITTATDVYSLGVVLFELLTGHPPYNFDNRSPAEMERVIRDKQPTRPSDAMTSDNDKVNRDIGSNFAIRDPRSLRGDLDNIILMALRKEPARRYSSVEQFSDDIRRHLVDLPVLARQDTLGYRADKFVRRHAGGVAATAAVTVLIAALVGFYTSQLAAERNRALAETAKAEQVSKFLTDLFAASDPRESGGDKLTAQQILDSGAKRIRTELTGQPEVQAALMDVMGVAYQNLGLLDQAEDLIKSALEIREGLHGKSHTDTAESMNHLASVYVARTEFKKAGPIFREALAIERGFNESSPEVADLLNNIAQVELNTGNFDEAERLYLEALALNRKLFGSDHREIATNLSNLGSVMGRQGHNDRALDYFRQGMEMRRRVLGNDHPDLAYSANNIAAMLHVQGKFDEAEPYYRESREIRLRALGEDHHMYCNTSNNLALLLIDKGVLEEAETILTSVLETYGRTLPFDHESNALARLNMALLLIKKGEHKLAEPFARDALGIQMKKLPAGSWRIAVSQSVLGESLTGQKQFEAAEKLLTESYKQIEKSLKPDDKRRKEALTRVIKMYEAWDKPERAAEYRPLVASEKDVAPR